MTVAAVALTGSNQQITAQPHDPYAGFSIRETTGTVAAAVRIWDNAAGQSSGTLLDTIGLAAGQSLSKAYTPQVAPTAGIWVQVVSGTVEGCVRVGR